MNYPRSTLIRQPATAPRPIRPTPDQPGTLGQQLAAIDAYFFYPAVVRLVDADACWDAARAAAIPHARREGADR